MAEDIKNYLLSDLQLFFEDNNIESFRAQQVFNWLYQQQQSVFSKMVNIPKNVRKLLSDNFYYSQLDIKKELVSRDGTRKFLFGLDSGAIIEAALIPDKRRRTLCISTQVGCRFGCRFCVSGRLGFKRNLTTAEIINQYLAVARDIKPARITHIVFMGIGEPLDNFNNLIRAIKILTDSKAIGFSPKKITVSSCGILPQLDEFFKLNLGVQFSLSLHAAIDAKRSQLMPVNRRYPLSQIIKTIKRNYHRHKNPVTFEYLLIKDFNGYAEDARALFKIMQGVKCHLNIIPYNHSPYFKWQSPTEAQIKYFKQQLVLNNISFTLRRPRGRDINAACGQLTITANHGT